MQGALSPSQCFVAPSSPAICFCCFRVLLAACNTDGSQVRFFGDLCWDRWSRAGGVKAGEGWQRGHMNQGVGMCRGPQGKAAQDKTEAAKPNNCVLLQTFYLQPNVFMFLLQLVSHPYV